MSLFLVYHSLLERDRLLVGFLILRQLAFQLGDLFRLFPDDLPQVRFGFVQEIAHRDIPAICKAQSTSQTIPQITRADEMAQPMSILTIGQLIDRFLIFFT
jgi:hypothetical protein